MGLPPLIGGMTQKQVNELMTKEKLARDNAGCSDLKEYADSDDEPLPDLDGKQSA